MKYLNAEVTFAEFPDEISLCINITNCPLHCEGCHSPELWKDIGTELTEKELSKLINSNKGITCVGFMGGKEKDVNNLAKFIKETFPELKVGHYTGHYSVVYLDLGVLDYIKIGPYMEDYGGLDNPNTNQKMFKVIHTRVSNLSINGIEDITYKFWKNE